MNKIEEVIFKILEIIEFQDNKKEFVDDFLNSIQLKAFIKLNATLNTENQELLKNKLLNSQSAGETADTIKNFFSVEQREKYLNETTSQIFTGYIETLTPTLSDLQATNLLNLLEIKV